MLEHQVQLKQNQRDEIAEKIAAFVMSGKQITVVRTDVFGNADLSLSDGRRPESFPTKTKGRKK